MPETLGDVSVNVFEEGPEAHKLHMEFVVATGQLVRKGMHVKMDATGKLLHAASGDASDLCIGVAHANAEADERVTVVMRHFTAVWAQTGAASTDAGPAELGAIVASGGDEATDPTLRKYVATTAGTGANDQPANTVGHILTPGEDGDPTLVAILP